MGDGSAYPHPTGPAKRPGLAPNPRVYINRSPGWWVTLKRRQNNEDLVSSTHVTFNLLMTMGAVWDRCPPPPPPGLYWPSRFMRS